MIIVKKNERGKQCLSEKDTDDIPFLKTHLSSLQDTLQKINLLHGTNRPHLINSHLYVLLIFYFIKNISSDTHGLKRNKPKLFIH